MLLIESINVTMMRHDNLLEEYLDQYVSSPDYAQMIRPPVSLTNVQAINITLHATTPSPQQQKQTSKVENACQVDCRW